MKMTVNKIKENYINILKQNQIGSPMQGLPTRSEQMNKTINYSNKDDKQKSFYELVRSSFGADKRFS